VNVQGVNVEETVIYVRLGTAALQRLRTLGVPCTKVWLTEQPDGTYALGVVTTLPPDECGLVPRIVETDDREARFPNWDGGFDAP
jgi:hypothetical protein